MADLASQLIAINREPRILVGTRSGRVLEFSVPDLVKRSGFFGLEGHAIRSLATSNDGSMIMAFANNGRGLVWDRASRSIVDEVRSAQPVVQCAPLARGDYVTLNNERTGHLWSRAQIGIVSDPVCDPPGVPLSFGRFGVSEDGGRLILLDSFRWRVWDRRTRSVVDSHTPIGGLDVDNPSGDIGLSANGRFYYTYWDRYLVLDTSDRSVVRDYSIVIDPVTSALSNDGRFLVIGGTGGAVVVIGPDGDTVFDDTPGTAVVVHVSIGADGRLATFVDEDGNSGCIDTQGRTLLIGRGQMERILGG